MAKKSPDPMTAGAVRRLIDKLPDDAPVFPHWRDGPPGDSDPAVEVFGFRKMRDRDGPVGLAVLVGITYLDELEAEENEDDDDD